MVILGNYVLQETCFLFEWFFFSFLVSFLYRVWYGIQINHNVNGLLNCFFFLFFSPVSNTEKI